MELADVLGWVAVCTFVVRLLPQPIRLYRTGIPDGVSPLTAINIALTELAWLVYGLAQGELPIWIVSIPSLPLAAWTVVLLRRQITRRDIVAAAIWGVVIALAWALDALGLVLGIAVIVQFGPQVWVALRTDDLTGISPNAWWLSILDAAVWGAFGVAIGDWALIGYAGTLSVFAVIILTRIHQTRDSDPDTDTNPIPRIA